MGGAFIAGLLMAEQAAAFGGAVPSMRLVSPGASSACLAMSASKASSDLAATNDEVVASTRRHAIKSLGALAASVVFRDAAFAADAAVADDDDEADGKAHHLPRRIPPPSQACVYQDHVQKKAPQQTLDIPCFSRFFQPPPRSLADSLLSASFCPYPNIWGMRAAWNIRVCA